MRTSLSFSILISLIFKWQMLVSADDFCQMSKPGITRAFIIKKDIYFGDHKSYWKMNVENFEITKNESVGSIFGENINLKKITTAVHFGDIQCPTCQQYKNAIDLVLAVGYLSDQEIITTEGYKAYRALDSGMSAIERNSSMPWSYNTEALLTGTLWKGEIFNFESVTFDEKTKSIVMSGILVPGSCLIYHKKLGEDGELKNDAFVESPAGRIFTGLIDWKGKIYGLSDDMFYLIEFQGIGKVIEIGQFSSKQFFNCEGNSPLKDMPSNNSTDNSTVGPDATPEVQGSETPENEVKETNTDSVTDLSSTSAAESNSKWIIWVIIIFIIVVVIVLIICCLFCRSKKSKEPSAKGGAEDTEGRKSKPDSQIISEGGSKVGTTRSALERVEEAPKPSLKSDSKSTSASSKSAPSGGPKGAAKTSSDPSSGGPKGAAKTSSDPSSGGPKGAAKTSSKSQIEPVVSLRSNTG